MNYSPSTRARIADLINGMRVDTGVLAAATYIEQTQHELFNVVGRVKIHNLFAEVTVVFSNNAALVKFNYTSATPAIGVADLCGVSLTVAQLAVGERIFWVGGAVATAAVLTATPGISDILATAQIVGGVTTAGVNYVGTIGILSTTASLTTGSFRASIFYSPMSDGAYVEAAV
ncbi:MAG: hypothetical protein A2W26_10160 [Acidobacteria bacterium RBG_16_64_8]|nr:MAG: hypothetical protein A2W26_10160 [Acidobacteria bacterium RBG_16_64_8]